MKSQYPSRPDAEGNINNSTASTLTFSIVMPAYNVKKYIKDAILSIKNQTYTRFECIIIDDGSTDGGVESIAEIIKGDERFIVKKQKNGGLSNARNAGLKIARGKYVLLLDSDDLFELNLLEAVNRKIEETEADVIVYNHTILDTITGHKSAPLHDFSPVKNMQIFTAKNINKTIFNIFGNQVWTKAVKRELIDSYNLGFDDSLRRAEDIPYTYGALLYAKSITTVDEGLVAYRVNRGDSNSDSLAEYYTDIFTSLDKVYSQLQTMKAVEVFGISFQNLFMENMNYNLYALVGTRRFVDEFKLAKQYAKKYGIIHNPSIYLYESLSDISDIILNKTHVDLLIYFVLKDKENILQKQTALFTKDDIISYKNSVIGDMEMKNEDTTKQYENLRRRYNKITQHPVVKIPLAVRRRLRKIMNK